MSFISHQIYVRHYIVYNILFFFHISKNRTSKIFSKSQQNKKQNVAHPERKKKKPTLIRNK